MIRLLYNLLFPVALVFFLPGYVAKIFRRGNYRRKFGQRFGFYSADTRERLQRGRRTWIHAVSVGEVAIALRLARKLRELDPSFSCALTTTTPTGFALAERQAIEWMEVMYHPLDFWPIVRRAFAAIRPVRLVLVEAEVWPNLVAIARQQRIAVALVNARLSPRSEARFLRFRPFVAPTFRSLDLVCVQEKHDVERWKALGVAPGRIQHVGSIKYDAADVPASSPRAAELLREVGFDSSRPVLFGGSTHAGEEELLASVFLNLRRELPLLLLIIAPRHVERARQIAARLTQLGLRVVLRTEAEDSSSSAFDCLLLNTTGELQHWYEAASVVFVGKSLTAQGGQNPVEPITTGKPVIFGPHMENFAALAAKLVRDGGAVQIDSAESLEREALRLLRDPGAAEQLVAKARAALAAHTGATTRTATLVSQLQLARD